MKILIVIFLLLSNNFAKAQFFSLKELITLSINDDDYFDTYVSKKNYTFEKFDESAKLYFYTGNDMGRYAFRISKDKDDIVLYTINKSQYIHIKEQIINSGYKFIKSIGKNSSVLFYYQKGNNKIALSSSKQKLTISTKEKKYLELEDTLYQINIYK